MPAYLRAIRREFGDAAYELMVGQGLPEEAEEWLEAAFPNRDRMYSFLQCLDNNPFDLSSSSSDSDSGEESGSGDEQGADEGPKNSPSPPPPPPSAEDKPKTNPNTLNQ